MATTYGDQVLPNLTWVVISCHATFILFYFTVHLLPKPPVASLGKGSPGQERQLVSQGQHSGSPDAGL